jgi:hypothetical protein
MELTPQQRQQRGTSRSSLSLPEAANPANAAEAGPEYPSGIQFGLHDRLSHASCLPCRIGKAQHRTVSVVG